MLEKNKNIVLREIHDSYFLIDITQNYLSDVCSIYEVNEIGKFIWESLETLVPISVAEEISYE